MGVQLSCPQDCGGATRRTLMRGFLVCYATQNTGYIILVPEVDKTNVTNVSVHVIAIEIIPDATADYFSELERLQPTKIPVSQLRTQIVDESILFVHISSDDHYADNHMQLVLRISYW